MCRLAAFLLLVLSGAVHAQGSWAAAPFEPKVFLLEDIGGRLSIADVRTASKMGKFKVLRGNALNAGFSSSVFWLRFEVPAALFGGAPVLIALGTPVLDRIDVFIVESDSKLVHHKSGDLRAYRQRAYPHRNPLFLTSRRDGRPARVFVRIGSEGTISARVGLWPERAYLKADAAELAFLGLYFGMILALMTYNLCLFLAIRDLSYVYYVTFLGAVLLLQSKLYGFADQLFWPAAPGIANIATLVFFALILVGGIQFSRAFLGTRTRLPKFDRVLLMLQGAAIALTIGQVVLSYNTLLKATIGLAAVVILVLAAAMIASLRRGYQAARFLLYAFTALAAGAVVYVARINDFLPRGLLTMHALELATLAEAILLSFALAHRINLVTQEKQRAEADLLVLQRRFSRNLIDSQEQDRARIARELHDSIGQNLLVIKNRLKRLIGADGEIESSEAIGEVAEVAEVAINEVRSIAQNLRPHQLDRLGLSTAIEAMAENAFRGSEIAYEADIAPIDGDLAPEIGIHIYRIVQEAVNNILKHSKGNTASIRLEISNGQLRLTVADNGKGIDGVDRKRAIGGFGITAMQERVQMIGGTFRIASGRANGTTLIVTVPVGAGK